MALKPYDELVKLDLTEYIDKRESNDRSKKLLDYINWAKIVHLLHENGAKKVYFQPVVNPTTRSSLYMTEQVFTDKDGNTNRVYETEIHIVIDELEFNMRGPVMNGSNPVKDNSMSQQRVWNTQTRLFAKGVAIMTGLGFNLWLKDEEVIEKENWEDDLSKHNLFKIKERCQQIYTNKIKQGLSVKDIADGLHKTEDEVKAIFSYFDTLNNFEKDLANLDIKSR